MPNIRITLFRLGACQVVHRASGTILHTDTPPEFGGGGSSFSSTDLLAAALGTCIATNIAESAVRHYIPLEAFDIDVEKELGTHPKRVTSLTVTISVFMLIPPDLLGRLQRAAESCVVRRALDPALDVSIVFRVSPAN